MSLPNPRNPSVVCKSQFEDRQIIIDLAFLIPVTNTISSVTVYQTSPITTPALTVSSVSNAGVTATVLVQGGLDGVSYGVSLLVVDNLGAQHQHTLAVLVQDDLAIKYQGYNPFAFQSLVDSIDAGDSAIGKAFFILPSNTGLTDQDISNGYVLWQLLDSAGTVYSSGNCYDYLLTKTSTYTAVEAHAVINAPSSMPSSVDNQKYQLRWELVAGGSSQYSYETLKVNQVFTVPQGAEDTVELRGDAATLCLVLDKPYEEVSVTVFGSGAADSTKVVVPEFRVTNAAKVSSGWYYQVAVDTSNLAASLDPYIVSWKYKNQIGSTNRETSRMYVANPSMLNCMKSIEQVVAKAKTTLTGFEDELFTPPVIMSMLARGRDYFNAAGGILTFITMTNAAGPIREFCLRYTEVALLQAQYLLEGEKAFNFSGQAISLDIDRSQYYQTLADSLKSSLDNDVKDFKKNLIKKGLGDGDGSMLSGGVGNMGAVGISISPVSPYGRFGFYR